VTLNALGSRVVEAHLLSLAPLGVAWLLVRVLHQQRASVRHHVWLVAVSMALLVPSFRALAPRVDVPLLRRPAAVFEAAIGPSEGTTPATGSGVAALSAPTGFAIRPVSSRAVVGILWLAGAATLVAVGIIRRIRLAGLSADAELLTGFPDVYVHQAVVVPIVAGVTHPRVLLPASAVRWPSGELEAVVAHERAHVMRCDPVTALMGDIATTLYWANPLVWIARLALDHERERACDDEVLLHGVKRSVYASALVRVARSVSERTHRTAPALAGGRLGDRIRAILVNPGCASGRPPLSWRSTAMLIFICTAAFSCVRALPRPAARVADETLFTVNGEIFTRSDLERYEVDAAQAPTPVAAGDPAAGRLSRILVEAVDEMVVVQRGKQLGYRLTDEQFQSTIANIKRRRQLADDRQFEAALVAERTKLAALRQRLERQMIVRRLQIGELSAHHPWSDYVDTLRSGATIDWKKPDLKRAYEDGLAQRSTPRTVRDSSGYRLTFGHHSRVNSNHG
jgi:beta-lactamase regulating signal transducer with metallopeptidase domain